MNQDFIEVYEDAVPKQTCADIIRRFEASGEDKPGLVGGGHYPELKNSRDISITGNAAWQDIEGVLTAAVLAGVVRYLRSYPYTLIAPLMIQRGSAEKPMRMSAEDFGGIPDAELDAIVRSIFRPGRINVQRYRAGEGGYPYWHCELYPRDAAADTLHRHLLWTVYLNDDFQAGETEFLHQDRKVSPRTGSLLLAPTAFTHTHRGNRPEGGDKYIATSWILFQRAEQLFAQG